MRLSSWSRQAMRTARALIVIPCSRSSSIESSSWSRISRSGTVPVVSSKRSESVVLPWSTCAMTQKLRISASLAIYPKAMGYSRRPCSPRNGGGSRAQPRPDNSEDLLQLADPQEVRRCEVHDPPDRRRQDRLECQHELGRIDEKIERKVGHADETEHGYAHEKARADVLQRRDAEPDEPQASTRREQSEEEHRLEKGRDRVREREPIDKQRRRERHAQHDVRADRDEREGKRRGGVPRGEVHAREDLHEGVSGEPERVEEEGGLRQLARLGPEASVLE